MSRGAPHILLLLCLTLSLAVAPAATRAQDARAEARAEAHDREGKVLYGTGDLEGAIREFRLAFRSHPQPSYLFNAGKALERLERFDEAVDTYEQYLRVVTSDDERAAAAELCERLCPKAGRGILVLVSEPPGASLVIDAEPYPITTGTRACLVPGEHVVSFSLDGHEDITETVRVPKAETVALRTVLRARRAVGTIRVESSIVPAEVYVDDRLMGKAPVDLRLGADRRVQVRVDAGSGYRSWTQAISVAAGHHKTLRAFPRPLEAGAPLNGAGSLAGKDMGSSMNWGYVTAGLGVALAITGGVLYAIAYDRFTTANSLNVDADGYDADFDALVSEGNGFQSGAFVSWGAAGALGVATAFVWDSGPAPDRQGQALQRGHLTIVGLRTGLSF
jgi:tetratricopeptide (TPR) repeat protein